MTDEEIRWVLNNLTPDQEKIIEHYCKNDSRELRKIGKDTWETLGVPQSDYDDLCDDAVKVLIETVTFFDPKKGVKFHTYLTGNIKRSAKDWHRDHYLRAKRNHLLMKNGKIVRDERGNPIIVQGVSLDAENEDGHDIKETVADSHTVEDTFFNVYDIESGSRLDKYLRELPIDQRRVAKMFIAKYKPKEIKEILHISDKQWSDIVNGLRTHEYISILYKK